MPICYAMQHRKIDLIAVRSEKSLLLKAFEGSKEKGGPSCVLPMLGYLMLSCAAWAANKIMHCLHGEYDPIVYSSIWPA